MRMHEAFEAKGTAAVIDGRGRGIGNGSSARDVFAVKPRKLSALRQTHSYTDTVSLLRLRLEA